MPPRFTYLSTISELPLEDPLVDPQTGDVIFMQPLAQRFRRRAILMSTMIIVLMVACLYFIFPFATGSTPLPNSSRNGRFTLVFYVSLLGIPYFAWLLTRFYRSRNYTRQIKITQSGKCFLNGEPADQQLHRGRVIINCGNQERKTEALWIQSGRLSFVIAAKDLPEDLDQIETILPVYISRVETETVLKGVL